MKRSVRWISAWLLPGCLIVGSGCAEMWHNLKPHRLSRLNRGPGMSTDAYNFSVTDPVTRLVNDAPSPTSNEPAADAPIAGDEAAGTTPHPATPTN